MHSFRLRLILALIAGVTIVSVASTYFEVLEHKHILRQELEWRSTWIGNSLKPQIRQALIQGTQAQGDQGGLLSLADLQSLVADAKNQTGALGIGVYDPKGHLITESGAPEVFRALEHAPFETLAKTGVQSLSRTRVEQSLQKGAQVNAFGHTGNIQWLEE